MASPDLAGLVAPAPQTLTANDPGYIYPDPAWVMAHPAHTVNVFGFHQWDNHRNTDGTAQFFNYDGSKPVLDSWIGYVLIVAFSILFACMAAFLVWVEKKFSGVENNTEQFSTAGRSLKSGLIAVDVVSHWTWPGNILGPAYYCYALGLAGFLTWTASQVVALWIFATMSIELKIRAPKAHTMMELVKIRYGVIGHVEYFIYSIAVNCVAVVLQLQPVVLILQYLCDSNVWAVCFMIPIGIMCYAGVGGLKATFTTSYIHTVIIYALLCWFTFTMCVGRHNGLLGNIDEMYARLKVMHNYYPIDGNYQGSYLTNYSRSAYLYLVSNFLSVFTFLLADQSYWQSSIAAKPQAAMYGYMLGCVLFFPIAYTLAFSGIGALVLDLPVSGSEISNGASIAALTYVLTGKVGPIMILVMVFMAVTSSMSGEYIAVSSLFTFDIYRTYLRKKASSAELVWVQRGGVMAAALASAIGVGIIVTKDVSLLLVSLAPTVFITSACPPIAAVLLWPRASKVAGILSAPIGTIAGLAVWLLSPRMLNIEGGASLDNLSGSEPICIGTAVNLGVSGLVLVVCSYIFPDKKRFDFEEFNTGTTLVDETHTGMEAQSDDALDFLRKCRPYVWAGAGVMGFLFVCAWPTLVLIQHIQSLANFRFQIVLGMVTMLVAAVLGLWVPLWEARTSIKQVVYHMMGKEYIDGAVFPMEKAYDVREQHVEMPPRSDVKKDLA